MQNVALNYVMVATVLTVYGIETNTVQILGNLTRELQQYLPFTVLKLNALRIPFNFSSALQQYLPFTVLKHVATFECSEIEDEYVATVLTVYGIETTCYQMDEDIICKCQYKNVQF